MFHHFIIKNVDYLVPYYFILCFALIFFLCELIFPSIYILLSMILAILKRPRTPPSNNAAMDYQTADSEHVLKRSRPFGISDEVQFQSICLSVYH